MNVLDQCVDYSRQVEMDRELHDLSQSNIHIIIGVGGIGYWLATMLAMMGTTELVLVDGDRLERTNLNRLPAPPRMVGKFKINACKAQLRLLRPGIRVTNIPAHITDETFGLLNDILGRRSGIVWDCTDDARIQIKISQYCIDNSRMYKKLGYEGFKVGMYSKMTDTWLPDDYVPGYTSSKANVLSSAICAALGVMYASIGRQSDMEVDLKTLVGG